MPTLSWMAQERKGNPLSVSLLALPETTPTTLYGLREIFSAVGVTWTELTGEPSTSKRIEARVVSKGGEPFRAALGAPIAPESALTEAGPTDVAIVTDLDLTENPRPRGRWSKETAWIRERFERGATVCSVCTGSVLLAEAGLLDGIEATTHWSATRIFSMWYPSVHLKAERILCPAGPEHRIITSGGPASFTDLALYLIARFCGVAEAVRISKIFVLGDHSDGQLPFAAMNRHRYHEDAIVTECQDWIAAHYTEASPVTRMVERSGLPERTFKRRFKAATSYSALEYVQTLRIEEAKRLLEATNMPTETIAYRVGYDDAPFFRRLFKRRTGLTPARYRRRFKSIVPAWSG